MCVDQYSYNHIRTRTLPLSHTLTANNHIHHIHSHSHCHMYTANKALQYFVEVTVSSRLQYAGPCMLEVKGEDLIVKTKDGTANLVRWKLAHIRSFKAKKDLLTIYSGRYARPPSLCECSLSNTSHYHTITPSHSHTITLSHLTPSHSHTITLSHSHTITLSHSHTLTPSHHHTLTPSHSHTITLSHSHTLTPSHHHTLTPSHSHTITLSHHHTLTPSHSHTSHHHTLTPHTITLSHHHTVTLSHSHTITLSHLTLSHHHSRSSTGVGEYYFKTTQSVQITHAIETVVKKLKYEALGSNQQVRYEHCLSLWTQMGRNVRRMQFISSSILPH